MERQPFSTTLSAQASYRLGEPVLVKFEIENTSSDTCQILKWGTPLEDVLTVDCFTVERDGEAIRYDGRRVKRGDPSPDSYLLLRPGERAANSVDISQAYAIDKPGDYTVSLKVTLFDAFVVAGNAKQAPRKRHNHEAHKLPPSSVSFKVVDGGEPKLTEGQAVRKAAKAKAKSSAKAPNFNGGTATEQADTVVAHNNAQYFAALSASQLAGGPASSNSIYKTWFGAFDQGRYDEVTKDYNDISNNLVSNQVTYDLSGSGCQSDWFAYTHDGSDTVWLCNSYKSAPQIGTDCMFGTLVHEWSHAVAGTDDNAYGQSACKDLANTDPQKAVDNADSHEYFAEELAQADFGKSFTFITDRSTFGKDEINAMLLQASPAVISEAFYIVADGFWPDKLGITASSLGNSPSVKPTITTNPSVSGMTMSVTSLQAEDVTLPVSPQRFTWVCQISFSNDSGFPTSPGATQTVNLTATLNSLTSSAQIILIREPNPYELDGPTSWLSTDVRVLQIRDGDSRFGATITGDAPGFIKTVLANLNAGNSGGQTFDDISTDEQTSALELSQKVNGTNIFNFAIAKVRYRGTADISNVRVFFRLFPASTTSTSFDGGTTYRRFISGSNAIPLLGLSAGGDLLTIPCFADARVDSSSSDLTSQTDPSNVRIITHNAGGAEVAAYFGCWLDINQTQPQIPTNPAPANGPWSSGRKSVQELIRNAHQCLVAEIAFDPDPIPPGISPAASDKMAQRNLTIVNSANPGFESSRRILSTFELHPAAGPRPPKPLPDELLIEWGNTPLDSIATIYIPEISANQVVALAGARFANHKVTAIDGQTIQVPVGGISYIPLPPGATFGLTGLMSVELPDTVRKGEVYKIVVRQVTDAFAIPIPVITKQQLRRATAISNSSSDDLIRWRRVVGTYQITIPVRTKEVMVLRERRLLSVLRWILRAVPADNRWYPVFSRYVDLMGDRVGGLGGDPGSVKPSPDGSGGEVGFEPAGEPAPQPERTRSYEGKVTGLIYDCFGDFQGFLLSDCGREREFEAREHRIEALARIAWRERIAVVVVTSVSHPRRPLSIILRRAPEPFQL